MKSGVFADCTTLLFFLISLLTSGLCPRSPAGGSAPGPPVCFHSFGLRDDGQRPIRRPVAANPAAGNRPFFIDE